MRNIVTSVILTLILLPGLVGANSVVVVDGKEYLFVKPEVVVVRDGDAHQIGRECSSPRKVDWLHGAVTCKWKETVVGVSDSVLLDTTGGLEEISHLRFQIILPMIGIVLMLLAMFVTKGLSLLIEKVDPKANLIKHPILTSSFQMFTMFASTAAGLTAVVLIPSNLAYVAGTATVLASVTFVDWINRNVGFFSYISLMVVVLFFVW